MSVVGKLLGFAMVLLLLFGAGLVVGRAVGPIGTDAPPATVPPSTSAHTGAHP